MSKALVFVFIDFLFNFVILLVALLYIQMQATKQAEGNTKTKAEFIISLDWDTNSPSDVDLWMRNPIGDTMYYLDKDIGLMTLDRDDLGKGYNVVTDGTGRTIIDPNRHEQASIRGIVAGTYTVNVMTYDLRASPVHVHVTVSKLNPYSVVFEREIVMDQDKQMLTVGSFTVDQAGNVINTDINTFVPMTGARK